MRTRRAFTLLEVMVAIAILGLALTVILSAQAGLYVSGASAQKISVAIGLVRCKMSEEETKLLKDGYPALDDEDDGPCCADDDRQDMHCSWKVEKIELPAVQTMDSPGGGTAGASAGSPLSKLSELGGGGAGGLLGGGAAGGLLGGGAAGGLLGGGGAGGGMPGALGTLLQLSSHPESFGGDGGVSELANDLTQGASAGGPGGIAGALAPMMMGMVYPQLKPLLEASIRKVTVKIAWKEGVRSRDFSIVQYVARPMFPPPPPDGFDAGAGGAPAGLIGGGSAGLIGGGSAGLIGGGPMGGLGGFLKGTP